jgi:hypothetical protein
VWYFLFFILLNTHGKNYEQTFSLWFMVFNTTFNNISDILWGSVLLVEQTEGLGGKHQPAASH